MKRGKFSVPIVAAAAAASDNMRLAGAAAVREALRQEAYREAIELLKPLLRQNPLSEWKLLLADAYAGRARELAAKGMFGEAAVVLENTISPADGTVREPGLYVVSLLRQGQMDKALAYTLKHLSGSGTPENSRMAGIAAALYLANPDCANSGGSSALLAAEAALRAWSGGQPVAEVERRLPGIPLRSPCGPLRAILKALVSCDTGKATQLLGMVPPDSPFAFLATTVREALPASPAELLGRWALLSPSQQSFVAQVRGIPATSTVMLNELEQAEGDGPAALFNALIKHRDIIPERELREACFALMVQAPDRIAHFEKSFGELPDMDRHRIRALASEAAAAGSQTEGAITSLMEVHRHWLAAIEALSEEPGEETRLKQAVIYRHLADVAAKSGNVFDSDGENDVIADYLNASVDADPDFVEGVLRLLARYRELNLSEPWHHRVDWAIKQFPTNPGILAHAVDAAVARKAYKKATAFSRTLLALDPINHAACARMIELKLSHARKQMEANRALLAAKDLTEAVQWERTDQPHALLRIVRGLVCLRLGQVGAEALLRDGVRLAGAAVVGWLRVVVESQLMGWRTKHKVSLMARQELASAAHEEPTREDILAVMAIFAQREVREKEGLGLQILDLLYMWLARGVKITWQGAEMHAIAEGLWRYEAYDLLKAYADGGVRRTSGDLVSRFYQLAAKTEGVASTLSAREIDELYEMMDETERRRDFQTARRIDRFLEGEVDDESRRSAPLSPPDSSSADLPENQEDDVSDEAEIGMMLDMLRGVAPEIAEQCVQEIGPERAVSTMMTILKESPLGSMLPEAALRGLCEDSVADAIVKRESVADAIVKRESVADAIVKRESVADAIAKRDKNSRKRG